MGLLGISGTLLVALITFAALVEVYLPQQTEKDVAAVPVSIEHDRDPFLLLSLEAKAAFVLDINRNKTLFSLNENAQLPLASVTKLMTALIASELLESDETITVEQVAIAQAGDSGFTANERWRMQDLLDFTLLESSNDGAYALAAAAGANHIAVSRQPEDPYDSFVSAMNEKARALELAQTYYVNATGLDGSEYVSGGYGSARDVALLLAHIVEHAPYAAAATSYDTLSVTSSSKTYTAQNTNSSLSHIPGIVASKTGFTDLAGGNLAVVFDAGFNHPVAVVVLGSTHEGRFRDLEKLVAASLEAI